MSRSGLRWIVIAVPIFLLGIEVFTFDADRYNTMEKIWGCIYGLGLMTFFGFVGAQRNLVVRVLTGFIMVCALISLLGWMHNLYLPAWKWNLQADGYVVSNTQKNAILKTMEQTRASTYLAGVCGYNYTEAPAVAVFSDKPLLRRLLLR